MSTWTNLVKKIYRSNKTKKGYKLGHAMKDAKKIYKNISKAHKGTNKRRTYRRGGAPPTTPSMKSELAKMQGRLNPDN